jgi:asparagine synthase (glutamine-hydrolysing)
MCGVFGIVSRRGATDVSGVLRQALTSLRHRGPDSYGSYITEVGQWEIGLAHTRLAILDLSASGHQPMCSSDGKMVLTFNGEIYNHLALRQELSDTPAFRGHSDTETIVAGMRRDGFEFGRRLRGMYAYGALDLTRERLRLARDPLGIKPLYYVFRNDCLLFASEIRALLDGGLVSRKVSARAAREYLETGSMGSVETVIEGILNVPTSSEIEIELQGADLLLEHKSVDDVFVVAPQLSVGRTEACQEISRLLRESVKRHLISDVPVGLFLSGGIDSTALMSFLSEVSSTPGRTFTVTFGSSELSEGAQAQRIAAHYGAIHHEITLSERSLIDSLPGALSSLDQPSADGVNSYVVSEAVRGTGLKVALSGLGGDELFAGYQSFPRQAMLARLGTLGRIALSSTSQVKRAFGLRSVFWEKSEDFLASGGDPESVCAVSRRLFSNSDIDLLLGSVSRFESQRPELPKDATNAVSVLELSRYMKNTLLRDCDVMSMAHGLEVRVPFLDVEFLRFVLSLPGSWKMDSRRPKPLLLDSLGGRIPEYIWRRRKMGFTLPFSHWMRGELGREISATLRDERLLTDCGLMPEAVGRLWADFESDSTGRQWFRPWSLYVWAKWCHLNGVKS